MKAATDAPPTMLQAALDYAAQGWPVFPCNPLDKRPLTPHGFKDATTDPEQIKAWWTRWPNAMVGVPMGAATGTFCVDLDRKPNEPDGVATWAKLESEHGQTPETRMHDTPSTGRHLLYKWCNDIRNHKLKERAPGIETRGEGGYIVVPPSVMADGKAYTGNAAAIADAPDWLLKIIRECAFREEIDQDCINAARQQQQQRAEPPPDPELIKAALDAISSDSYDDWFKMAGAIRHELGDAGFKLFDDWSRQSKKYNAKAVRKKWDAARDIHQITAGTIFYEANKRDPNWRERYKQTRNENYGPGGPADGGQHARQQDDWELVVVRMSTIKSKKIIWLWQWRIALGKLTIFAGLPDTNKSTIALDLAARITVGGPLPAGEGQAPLGNVIILSAEDDVADTIKPRLEVAGGDPNRIYHVPMVEEKKSGRKRGFDLTQDIERLEHAIIKIGNVKLVIIDPVSAYLGKPGKLDTYRQSDVRGTLSPLEEMAARHGVSIVGIEHLNKKSGLKALLRVGGSIAFAAAPRSLIIFVRDEEDQDRRLVLPAKNNNAPEKYKTGLACRIIMRLAPPPVFDVMPAVKWEEEPVSITADEALEADGKKTDQRRSETAEMWKVFLQEFLRAGPRMVKDIESEAKKRDLNPGSKSMRTAKEALKIISRRKGTQGWEWTLPGQQGDLLHEAADVY